uniref:Uncharacterized protein n=1 Tax=Glossina austeni TaxID=7395 RepID=A0A1A9UG74_GLOAU
MEYLCILNAFKQNYYNRINELEHAHTNLRNSVVASSTTSAGTDRKRCMPIYTGLQERGSTKLCPHLITYLAIVSKILGIVTI